MVNPVVTKREGARKQPAAHQHYHEKRSCAWKRIYMCIQCIKWRCSPDTAFQHIPTLLSTFIHICPLSSIYFLNPTVRPSVYLPLWLLTLPTQVFFSPCVFTQTSFSLFFPHFILPSLFSPSDPAQMASRCCSSSFAFTNISSAHTAKKTLEEMLTVFGKEAGKRVVEDSFVMD